MELDLIRSHDGMAGTKSTSFLVDVPWFHLTFSLGTRLACWWRERKRCCVPFVARKKKPEVNGTYHSSIPNRTEILACDSVR